MNAADKPTANCRIRSESGIFKNRKAKIVKTEGPDVHVTQEYRSGAAMMDPVPNALGLCLFALFMLTLDDKPPVGIVVASGVVLTARIGWIVFALYRRSHPGRALFVLSPGGILYPIYRAKAALIPWHEVENVDTIDIATRNWAANTRILPLN